MDFREAPGHERQDGAHNADLAGLQRVLLLPYEPAARVYEHVDVPYVGGERTRILQGGGTTYGALEGELLHHFQIKTLEAEHISLDFYTHLVGSDVIPAFVQLRIGSDLDEKDARFIAYRFDSFQPLQSLPVAGGPSSTSRFRLIRST